MTNTATVEKAGEPKEKVEKRRALGRGLESLLPGPRPVLATPPIANDKAAKQHMPPVALKDNLAEPAAPAEQANAGGPEPAVIETLHSVVEDDAESAADADRSTAVASASHSAQAARSEGISLMAQAESRVPGNLVVQLAIADIDKNPFQTRYVGNDDALEELANSIKANGVLQPVVVRPAEKEGRYILILGERRLHASKRAGRETIPAVVRRVSDQQAAEMTIIENLQRQDLSPLEQAEAFRVLSTEFKMTQQQIGERVGLSRESVANYMRLLKLPRTVMELLAEKKLSFAEARELLKLDDNDKIAEAALYAVKKGMTVEQVEKLVLRMNGWLDSFAGMPGQERKKTGARWIDPNVRAAQVEMEQLLGVKVKIRDHNGKGKIVIEYSNVDDYERVVGMLKRK